MSVKQVILCLSMVTLLVAVSAFPDGGESPPLPGPGLSYGGIPYGSVSGKVADYYQKGAAPSGRSVDYGGYASNPGVDYSPIKTYLL